MTDQTDKLAEAKKEIWKDVLGYEGKYQVSDLGRVKSFQKGIEKILKPFRSGNKGTRLSVGLSKSKKSKTTSIHRLVLEAFVGPCPEGMECCHYDGNPCNNALTNLRWDTHKNNELDKIREGKIMAGERNGMAKLKDYAVDFIREASRDGISAEVLMEMFYISESHIYSIRNGEKRNHVKKCCLQSREEQMEEDKNGLLQMANAGEYEELKSCVESYFTNLPKYEE